MIDSYAFSGCTKLENLKISEGVKKISSSAFSGCTSLVNVVIPDSVITLGAWAFNGCNSLTSVVIGNGITSIDTGTFQACTNLNTVYFAGDKIDWAAIIVGSSNTSLTGATLYYYSETQPTDSGNYWHYDANSNPIAW